MTPEGKIKAKIRKMLKGFGPSIWSYMPVQGRWSKRALDYIVCANGWFVSIEAKKNATAPLTPMQEITRSLVEEAGGLVLVVYDDVTLEMARSILYGFASHPPRS